MSGFSDIDPMSMQLERRLLDNVGPTISISDSPVMLAQFGKPALTALYTECFMTIDSTSRVVSAPKIELPKFGISSLREAAKTAQRARWGKLALGRTEQDLLELTSQAIMLNPSYNDAAYSYALSKLTYSEYREPPEDYLVEKINSDILPEKALAMLYRGVAAGFSIRRPAVKSWQKFTPENVVKVMRLGEYVDGDVLDAVGALRQENEPSIREYIPGLLELEETKKSVADKKQDDRGKFRRSISNLGTWLTN
jgi:hypothetical protein